MRFPTLRLRRLRKSPLLRNLVAETHLQTSQLIYPMFIAEHTSDKRPIASMPGIYQHSLDSMLKALDEALASGIRSVLLFGVPDEKDQEASSAWREDGIIQRAVQRIRAEYDKALLVMTDTCLCEYMSHGHCGIVMDGKVLNDPSVEILGRVAVAQAQAGADVIAPSDMMDGRIMWIREMLDNEGFEDIPLMAYSAKYASAFYGPFREAAKSAPAFGDRKTYQMDPRNSRESLQEVSTDLDEGADIVMVKPAMAYLDIIQQVRSVASCPVAAYSVSGEYSMIKAAAQNGWLDERETVLEVLTGIRRAGADMIITYHAVEAARWLGRAIS